MFEVDYTTEEIAERLGWSLWVTRQRIKDMRMKPKRVGKRGRHYYRHEDLMNLLLLDQQVRRGIWTWEQAIAAQQVIHDVFHEEPAKPPAPEPEATAMPLERLEAIEAKLDRLNSNLELVLPIIPELAAAIHHQLCCDQEKRPKNGE